MHETHVVGFRRSMAGEVVSAELMKLHVRYSGVLQFRTWQLWVINRIPFLTAVIRQENRVVLARFLAQLDGNGLQLTCSIHMEQTEWSCAVGALLAWHTIHDL